MELFLLVVFIVVILVVFARQMLGSTTSPTETERPIDPEWDAAHHDRRYASNEIREAWLSGDLQRMIRALDSKADDLVNRHFLLLTVAKETYRLHYDPRMADKCL